MERKKLKEAKNITDSLSETCGSISKMKSCLRMHPPLSLSLSLSLFPSPPPSLSVSPSHPPPPPVLVFCSLHSQLPPVTSLLSLSLSSLSSLSLSLSLSLFLISCHPPSIPTPPPSLSYLSHPMPPLPFLHTCGYLYTSQRGCRRAWLAAVEPGCTSFPS